MFGKLFFVLITTSLILIGLTLEAASEVTSSESVISRPVEKSNLGKGNTKAVDTTTPATMNRLDDEETDPNVLNAGGYRVSIKQYPYATSVSFDGEVSCTGILVDSRYFLTSYVCFNETASSNSLSKVVDTSVRIGSDYFDKMGKVNRLKWIYDHPMVMAGNSDHYGFVMAEFDKPLTVEPDSDYDAAEFSDLHDPWHLRTSSILNDELVCGLIGFGRNQGGSNRHAGVLHYIPFKLMKPSDCKEAGVDVQPEFELCAAAPVYRESACLDEVGAPLVCYGKVYGVLSSRDGTCGVRLDRPTVFLRADQAVDFMALIKDCLDNNECSKTRSTQIE